MLFNGDCLEVMKTLDDKSVDLVFCDLPYGQTSCKWDCKIDLEQFWKQIMRIKKLNTPIFFTTTTKFGVELIQSAPKKCFFRYDLVWVKSAAAGFLSAKKMPMRKHEMIYVFYEKLPLYDLSRHKHKFKTITKPSNRDKNSCYGSLPNETSSQYEPPLPNSVVKDQEGTVYGDLPTTDSYAESVGIDKADKHKVHYDPPLPNSVVKEPEPEATTGECYGNQKRDLEQYKDCGKKGKNQVLYDPPLPNSVVKEECYDNGNRKGGFGGEQKGLGTVYQDPALISSQDVHKKNGLKSIGYDPPLPNSVVKEPEPEEDKYANGTINSKTYDIPNKSKGGMYRSPAGQYDPPLPNSVVKEGEMIKDFTPNKNGNIYNCPDNQEFAGRNGAPRYDPPLPVSVIKKVERKSTYGDIETHDLKTGKNNAVARYDPPLPVSVVKEEENNTNKNSELYGKIKGNGYSSEERKGSVFNPPLPNSILKENVYIPPQERENKTLYADRGVKYTEDYRDIHGKKEYEPPLPHTLLEVKSTRGKHSTEKPVALMEWILSYYSKEGDVVLDPTMGSGSTGVACKNLKRKFIGIEMDADIFEVAKSRNPDELVKG